MAAMFKVYKFIRENAKKHPYISLFCVFISLEVVLVGATALLRILLSEYNENILEFSVAFIVFIAVMSWAIPMERKYKRQSRLADDADTPSDKV